MRLKILLQKWLPLVSNRLWIMSFVKFRAGIWISSKECPSWSDPLWRASEKLWLSDVLLKKRYKKDSGWWDKVCTDLPEIRLKSRISMKNWWIPRINGFLLSPKLSTEDTMWIKYMRWHVSINGFWRGYKISIIWKMSWINIRPLQEWVLFCFGKQNKWDFQIFRSDVWQSKTIGWLLIKKCWKCVNIGKDWEFYLVLNR